MNIKHLIEKATSDWPAKVICLCLAIFIYSFHQISTLSSKTFSVPMNVISGGSLMSTDVYPAFVKVEVKTEPTNLVSITPGDLKATLNLTGFIEPGVYEVPVTFELSSRLMDMEPLEISISPDTVKLNLEEKVLKYIPVTASTSGEPDYGYYVSNLEVVPSSVKVIGPKSIVDLTEQIYTKKVMVKGAKTTFSSNTQVDNINTLLEVYPESDFKVNVEISPQQSSRKIDKLKLNVAGLSEKLIVSNVLPLVSFEISGSLNSVEKFTPGKNTVSIDLSSFTEPGEYEANVRINVSDNFQIKGLSHQTVKVTLVEKTLETEEEAVSENGEKLSGEDLNQ